VAAAARRSRTKTITAGGGFKVTFTSLSIGSCDAYSVRAKGNRGSIAFLKVRPECPPPAIA
jgi:hypothetical protein